MEEEVYFINQEGQKIFSEEISSHIGLANIIIDKDEEIKQEFESSGKQNSIEFLIVNKGFIAVSNMKYYHQVTYDSSVVSEIQKKLIQYYKEEGYSSNDFELERRKMERGEI